MEIVIQPQHWSAILCIALMIGGLIFSYIKKISVTFTLIGINVAVFIITLIFYKEVVFGTSANLPYAGLGFRSIYLTSEKFPQIYTLFTSMFIHGGFAHILGNMFILLLIGLPFEQRVGWKNFLIIYFITGICGALVHSFLDLGSNIPLIGASGAIFGIMGAFAFSYPRDKVHVPIGYFIAFLVRLRVMYAVAFYALLETLVIWWESQSGTLSNTAHYAHIGGLISGFILAAILLRGRKTHTTRGETIYYDSYNPQRPSKIDFSSLRKLAITPELKQMLRKVEQEDVPQVRDIWLDHFLEKTVCPRCGNNLNHFNGKIWCKRCGFKTKY